MPDAPVFRLTCREASFVREDLALTLREYSIASLLSSEIPDCGMARWSRSIYRSLAVQRGMRAQAGWIGMSDRYFSWLADRGKQWRSVSALLATPERQVQWWNPDPQM